MDIVPSGGKSSVDARVAGAELLLVVVGDELLDVGQLVVEILTAVLLLVVVGIGLQTPEGREENNNENKGTKKGLQNVAFKDQEFSHHGGSFLLPF